MTADPPRLRAWHLALLPAVLVANYLFMTARHEAAHGLVVLAFGGEIAELHVWPPASGVLSWITFRLPLAAPPAAVPLQAAAPMALALALVAGGVWAVCRVLPPGLARANVALAAVVFPCCEIATTTVGYWYGRNDLYWAFGATSPGVRLAVALAGTAVAALAVGAVLRRAWSSAA